ncbi:MAG: hypothetical protein ABIR70_13095 [Bryobacteraceae bacterium]
MSELISNAVGIVGMGLQVLALILLIRGPFSRYFPLFLFLFTSSVTTIGEGWVLRTRGGADPMYYNVYWGGEILLDGLLFFLVISLTVRALEGSPLKPKIVRFLTIVLAVVVILPFILFDSEVFGRRWNQSVAQLLNFGAAVMNLGLWSALVMTRLRDRQLLTVSAGLGVAVAGAALTLGVRQFTHQGDLLREISDSVHRISQIASPAIWCWAFRPAKPRLSPPVVPTTAVV